MKIESKYLSAFNEASKRIRKNPKISLRALWREYRITKDVQMSLRKLGYLKVSEDGYEMDVMTETKTRRVLADLREYKRTANKKYRVRTKTQSSLKSETREEKRNLYS